MVLGQLRYVGNNVWTSIKAYRQLYHTRHLKHCSLLCGVTYTLGVRFWPRRGILLGQS